MDIIDLHCDTLTRLEKHGYTLNDIRLHVTPEKASSFGRYIQVGAIWSDRGLSDSEAWERFDRVVDLYSSLEGKVPILTPEKALEADRAVILAVEGARLLCGELPRLDHLYNRGVRILTLNWSGHDCVGGAWDTEEGLTTFGEALVERCFEFGIIPDISHSSQAGISQALDLAQKHTKCIIASHSNSYAVCPHRRNLTDSEFCRIVSLGGVVGISLCPYHLSAESAGTDDVIRHIYHYMELGGEHAVVLGCDFDGIEQPPEGIADISDLPRLYEAICRELGESTAKHVFFENAYEFLKNNFTK